MKKNGTQGLVLGVQSSRFEVRRVIIGRVIGLWLGSFCD